MFRGGALIFLVSIISATAAVLFAALVLLHHMPRAWITFSIFNSIAVAITALFSLFPLALPHSLPPAFDTYKILVAPPPSFYPRVIQDISFNGYSIAAKA